jgi:hypothetical protein
VGGVTRGDTLVSTALDCYDHGLNPWDWHGYPIEFWPDIYPFGGMVHKSNIPGSKYYDSTALAEYQVTAEFADTLRFASYMRDNPYDYRDHQPLGIKVTQTSYTWSAKYAQDFMIVDYTIRNISQDTIFDAWIGMYNLGCVRFRGEVPSPPSDDIAGYLYSTPSEIDECGEELVRMAYCRDNDGHAYSLPWYQMRTSDAIGVAPLRLPELNSVNNFNWWNNDDRSQYNWGPREVRDPNYPLRLFADRGVGAPYTDRDKYYLMSKPEIDYPGHEAAVDHTAQGWLPPHYAGEDIAKGHLPEFVTSYGPVTLLPEGETHLTVAVVLGEDVHWNERAYRDVFDPDHPDRFADQLDFSDIIENLRWARRIYDNPGVDTNNDGDSGRAVIHIDPVFGDTVVAYCGGDGVPDFNGAGPPPAPLVRVIPEDGRITVRWNGQECENTFDPFTLTRDFEGYRIYLSRSDRAEEMVLLGSFDRPNFNRYRWDDRRRAFRLVELPLSADEVYRHYGDDFDPLMYTPDKPLYNDGELVYFTCVDFNESDLTANSRIHKVYPDAIDDPDDVDDEGRQRYYEYEFFIEDLLPSVPYWVSVTAFDYGHPPKKLEPMESSTLSNMVQVYAQQPTAENDDDLNVYCYPNPYRVDGQYPQDGYENRTEEIWYARARCITFANLPSRCDISILSLDGDFIDKIHHNEPSGSGTASTATWDLITVHSRAVVTGVYYWVVESDHDTQIGKLVILK